MWVYDCLLSFLISLCKHCSVRGISLFLDARVNFSFMPRFPETHTKSDTLTVRSQTVRAERRRHLWWNKLKSLWCCASLWGWFQLLCALQGRPPTASPTKLEMAPVHLPYSETISTSCFPVVCLAHNTFVPLCAAHWGGCRELSGGKERSIDGCKGEKSKCTAKSQITNLLNYTNYTNYANYYPIDEVHMLPVAHCLCTNNCFISSM